VSAQNTARHQPLHLVALDDTELIELRHLVADLDLPLDELHFRNGLSDVRQVERHNLVRTGWAQGASQHINTHTHRCTSVHVLPRTRLMECARADSRGEGRQNTAACLHK
jgi:hypothetical protein